MALNPLSARMFPAWVESTHLESAINGPYPILGACKDKDQTKRGLIWGTLFVWHTFYTRGHKIRPVGGGAREGFCQKS